MPSTPSFLFDIRKITNFAATLAISIFLQQKCDAVIPGDALTDNLYDLGYLNVTHYDGVEADSGVDSTAGIQGAIDDAYENNLVLYFPTGTYLVSDTLRFYEWRTWNSAGYANNPVNNKQHVIVGEAGATRPIIKLIPSASAFGSKTAPRPIVCIRAFSPTNASAVPDTSPDNPLGEPANFKEDTFNLYDTRWQGVDIDCNGNNGAIGMYFPSAQNCALLDTMIDATGSVCGVFGLPGRNSLTGNIEVVGGDYGLVAGSNYAAASLSADGQSSSAAGINVTGARLIDQEIYPFIFIDSGPSLMVGFHIEKSSNGPVTKVHLPSNWNTAGGNLVLIDGTIELSGSAADDLAIDNADGRNVYLRNVYVSGSDNLIQSGSSSTVTGSGTWKRIGEYCYNDQRDYNSSSAPLSYPTYAYDVAKFESRSLIGGTVSSAAEPSTDIDSLLSSGDVPSDLIARHIWAALPEIEDDIPYIDITNLPSGLGVANATPANHENPQSETTSADSAAIQAAIDEASSLGHGRVFIPKGIFNLDAPLILRENTVLFGPSSDLSLLKVHKSWAPTSGSPYMVTTDNDADATTTIAFIGFETPVENRTKDIFGCIQWRAGRGSMIIDCDMESDYPPFENGSGQNFRSGSKKILSFIGNGGGRHYGIIPHDIWSDSDPDIRLVSVNGTSEPLSFYGLNLEISKNQESKDTAGAITADFYTNANAEIINAANVRIYGIKREGNSPTLLIDNSSNIAMYANGAMISDLRSTEKDYITVKNGSSDILLALICPRQLKATPSVVAGQSSLIDEVSNPDQSIPFPNMVSLYKRGTIDDSVMYGGSTPDTPSGIVASDGTSSSQINVSWNDVSDETGYRLTRSNTSGGTYSQIGGDLSANSTSYSDTQTANTTRYYKIAAFNSYGSSAASNYDAGSTSASGGGSTIFTEAEDGNLSSTATVETYYGSGASGGEYVTLDASGETVQWSVNPGSGSKTVTIRYACANTKLADIKVNGSTQITNQSFVGTGRGNYLNLNITVNFSAGSNTLQIAYKDTWALDIDYIEVESSGGDLTDPTVSLTSPSAGSVSGTSVNVSANASDNVGVIGVQFKLDGVNLGSEDTTAPFSRTWNSTEVSDGSHSLTAVARDAAGNTSTSSAVSVSVSNAVFAEAEAGNISGGASTGTYYGAQASGSSYVTLDNNNEAVLWSVTPGSGTKTLTIRYACAATKTVDVKVNNTVQISNQALTGTGRGDGTWTEVDVSILCTSGSNNVQLIYTGPGYAVDIDYIEIQ